MTTCNDCLKPATFSAWSGDIKDYQHFCAEHQPKPYPVSTQKAKEGEEE